MLGDGGELVGEGEGGEGSQQRAREHQRRARTDVAAPIQRPGNQCAMGEKFPPGAPVGDRPVIRFRASAPGPMARVSDDAAVGADDLAVDPAMSAGVPVRSSGGLQARGGRDALSTPRGDRPRLPHPPDLRAGDGRQRRPGAGPAPWAGPARGVRPVHARLPPADVRRAADRRGIRGRGGGFRRAQPCGGAGRGARRPLPAAERALPAEWLDRLAGWGQPGGYPAVSETWTAVAVPSPSPSPVSVPATTVTVSPSAMSAAEDVPPWD